MLKLRRSEEHKEELHKYITGIIQNKKQKLIAINSMPDHTHLFRWYETQHCIIRFGSRHQNNSSTFINEKKWVRGKFNWQERFGAFSYGHSQIDAVVKYIQNQEKHHAQKTFKEEYIEILRKFNVEFDTRYLFNWFKG